MPKFKFQLKGGYVVGLLTIPTEVGAVQVATLGGSKADALMRAATIAQRISEDPVMAALMPPQAAAAIAAAKALSSAARKGPRALKSLWGRIRGPGKRRLAEALAREQAASSNVGALYWGQESRVRQPDRGAWERYLDPEYDDDYDDDDDDYVSGFEVGRRKRRKKRRGKSGPAYKRAHKPKSEPEPEPEPEPAAPLDYQAQPTEYEYSDDADGAEDSEVE